MAYWCLYRGSSRIQIMKTEFRVKVRNILFADSWSFLLCMMGGVLLGASVILSPLFALLMPLVLAAIFWRVSLIKSTIAQGRIVTAIIDRKRFVKGEWLVYYTFNACGKDYQKRAAIVSFGLPIEVDEALPVVYDPKKPERAFMPKLYGARKV